MSGAQAVLEMIHEENVPHCVVTNSTRKQIEKIQEKIAPLKTIPLWITREDYQNPKPAPDGYLEAVKRLGCENGLGFEDSMRGVESLKGANIKPLLICSSDHPQMETVSQDISHFETFEALLAAIEI